MLAKGKAADLLVLEKNPLDNIAQHADHPGQLSWRQEIRVEKRSLRSDQR